ncbi:Uncharacterised protein [Burkholderia pseudomallei]|nr:Uncharacterised protein [Burkholderia pseudomallei]CPF29970.1 Uncharacterised protein [Burkholderia pseudomallei]CPG40095.1 Uncharacterised protein [Burkholderia pseudomallei]CPH10907.1 Uncharacterised protein [Burkholderia pseudomallei]
MSLAAFLAAGFAFEARACGEGARRAGDRRRLVAGIGGHWRALVGAVAAGISARFADALFDMHVGLGALHSSGVRVLLADEPTSRRADEPTSRRADEPTSRHADGSTVPSVYESIPVSPMQSRRLADSPIHRFTDLPIYRFTDSPAHAARRCRGPAARSVRSSAPAFIPPRHDGRPPSPGRSKPHGGAAISAAHRAPPPSIPSKLTAVVSHEFFSCLS